MLGIIFSLVLFLAAMITQNRITDLQFVGMLIASAIFYCGACFAIYYKK